MLGVPISGGRPDTTKSTSPFDSIFAEAPGPPD
jgi:hypothetical protein